MLSIFFLIPNKTTCLSQEIKVSKNSIADAVSKELNKSKSNQLKIEPTTKESPKTIENVQIVKVLWFYSFRK